MLQQSTMRHILREVVERLPGSLIAGGYPVSLVYPSALSSDIDIFVPRAHRARVGPVLQILFPGIVTVTSTQGYETMITWLMTCYRVAGLNLNFIVVNSENLTLDELYSHFDLDICKVSYDPVPDRVTLSSQARDVRSSGINYFVRSEVSEERLSKYIRRCRGFVSFQELI